MPSLLQTQSQAQTQTLRLTPQLRQSLRFLQMPDAALAEDLEQTLASNPALLLPLPPAPDPAPDPAAPAAPRRPLPPPRLVAPEILQRWIDYRTASLTDSPSLYSHLEPQIIREALPDPLKNAALYLAGSLDPATLRPESPLPRISRESSIPLPLLEEAWSILRELDLSPPESPVDAAANRILPEVRFLPSPSSPGAYTAEPLDTPFSALRIDESFSPSTPDARRQLRDARAYLSLLSARSRTLLDIARAIAAAQSDCLRLGFERLAPLSMSSVAARLSLAVSTVSRAVSGKAALLPSGAAVELRAFFSPPVAPGSPVSASALRLLVRRVVAAESPSAPLSDSAVAARLAALTPPVRIARRTVAKARAALRIPPAPLRRPRP